MIESTINDSGIICLPDGTGHVALTVFTKDMGLKARDVEDLIAQIARFVYGCLYFTYGS